MVVRDKTRESASSMAMGMQRNAIRRVFLIQVLHWLVGPPSRGAGADRGRDFNSGHWIPIDPSIYFIDHLPG